MIGCRSTMHSFHLYQSLSSLMHCNMCTHYHQISIYLSIQIFYLFLISVVILPPYQRMNNLYLRGKLEYQNLWQTFKILWDDNSPLKQAYLSFSKSTRRRKAINIFYICLKCIPYTYYIIVFTSIYM